MDGTEDILFLKWERHNKNHLQENSFDKGAKIYNIIGLVIFVPITVATVLPRNAMIS